MFQINYKLLSLALIMLTVVILFQCADKRDTAETTVVTEHEMVPGNDYPGVVKESEETALEPTQTAADIQVDLSETISKLDELIDDLNETRTSSHGEIKNKLSLMASDLQLEKDKLTRRAELLSSAEQDERAEVINNISGAIRELRVKMDEAENLVDDAEELI